MRGDWKYPELWTPSTIAAWCPSQGCTWDKLLDYSGRGKHGVLTNMAPGTDWMVSDGKVALNFDGVDGVARATVAVPTFPFTLAGWFRLSALAAQYAFGIFASGSDDPHFGIDFTAAGTIRGLAELAGQQVATSTSTYSVGKWLHVCWVVSSLTKRDLYINGTWEASSTPSVAISSSFDRLSVGRFDRLSPALPYGGAADDLWYFAAALTPPTIRLLARQRGIAYERETRRRAYIAVTANRRRQALSAI